MSHSQLREIENKKSSLKKTFWGDKTVILHSRDIRKCDKEFKILFDLDIKKQFYEDLDGILEEKGAYSVVSCSILKEPYIRQFGKFNDIYGQSLSFLIERSIFYLDDVSDNADMHIMAEMRGKQQDQSLLNYYNRLRVVVDQPAAVFLFCKQIIVLEYQFLLIAVFHQAAFSLAEVGQFITKTLHWAGIFCLDCGKSRKNQYLTRSL